MQQVIVQQFFAIIIDPEHILATADFLSTGKLEDLCDDVHERIVFEKPSLTS